jgi:hypothetical protein
MGQKEWLIRLADLLQIETFCDETLQEEEETVL